MTDLHPRNSWLWMVSLVAVGLVVTSYAEDEKIPEIKTSSGRIYHDVQVTKVTPSEISIMHESGAGRIPLNELPDDLKAKFGYDPAKAAEFQNQENAKKAKNQAVENRAVQYQKKLKSALPRRFKVTGIVKSENGVLANIIFERFEKETVLLTGKLYSNLVDGTYIEASCFEDGIYDYSTTAGSTSTVKKFEVIGMHIYPGY